METSSVTTGDSQNYKLLFPEIMKKPKKKREVLNIKKDELEHRLEDFVRLQYLKYVEGVLRDNYNLWLQTDIGQVSELVVTDEQIRKTAENLEVEALKACMVVSLYRKTIIKTIKSIKNETQQNLLNGAIMKTKFNGTKPNNKNAATQTENNVSKRIASPTFVDSNNKKTKNSFKQRSSHEIDVSVATLDEKIRRFQESFIKDNDETSEPKHNVYPGIIQTPTRPPMTPTINLNDLLQQKPKQQFFAPATPNSIISQTPSINLAQVPATPTCFLTPASTCTSRDPQDEIELKIMQELNEMFGEEEKDLTEEATVIKTVRREKTPKTSLEEDKNSSENSPVIDLQTLSEMKDPEEREREMKQKLMSSIWPCELHYQKTRLRTVLSDIADRNFRKYEKIKQRFRELFDDDDSENELAPYSPTIELDEIVLASCRKRISHWVVKSLMKPYKNGQIAKFLFKRLAKHLAENIIYQDQYPSETIVKEYIYEFLCRHPRIVRLEDMLEY